MASRTVEPSELRYVDGPSTESAVTIAAPPAVLWALVADSDV